MPTPSAPRTRWARSNRSSSCCRAWRRSRSCSGSTGSSPHASGAGSTSASWPRRPRSRVLTLVAIVGHARASAAPTRPARRRYSDAVDAASARTAGNDAKANESLRLINRGSGQVYEDAWAAAAARSGTRVGRHRRGTTTWTSTRIVTLDTNGRWDDAVELATTTDAQGSTAAFEAFDEQSREAVASSGRTTTDELRTGNSGILVLAVVTLLAGLAAAGAAAWGVGQRRKEYA